MAEPTPARPPDTSLRVALLGNVAGFPWVNRFWLDTSYSGTPTAAQVLALSNAISAAWRTRFLQFCNASVHLTGQRTVLFTSSTTEIAVNGTDAGSGTATGASVPPQVSIMLNWAISGSYRGGHPRTYLPPSTVSWVEGDGAITGSNLAAINTATAGFLSDVNALSPTGFSAVALGTFRFFRHHAAVDPPVFEPFTSGSCHPHARTQRRRAGR